MEHQVNKVWRGRYELHARARRCCDDLILYLPPSALQPNHALIYFFILFFDISMFVIIICAMNSKLNEKLRYTKITSFSLEFIAQSKWCGFPVVVSFFHHVMPTSFKFQNGGASTASTTTTTSDNERCTSTTSASNSSSTSQ